MSDLKELLEQTDRALGGGGRGGAVGYVDIMAGFKIFTTGMNFFPFKPGDETEMDAAFARAQEVAGSTGATFDNRRWGITIRRYRDKAYKRGELVTWSVPVLDEYEHYWTSGSEELVQPSLDEHGITKLPWSGWVRLAWADDPDGYLEVDNRTGEDRVKQIAYISEVFPSEAAAMAVVNEMTERNGAAPSIVAEMPGFEEKMALTEEGLPIPASLVGMEYEGRPFVDTCRETVVNSLTSGTSPDEIAKAIGGGFTGRHISEWASFYNELKAIPTSLGSHIVAAQLGKTVETVDTWRALIDAAQAGIPF